MIFCEEQFPALVTNDSGMLLPLSTNSKPWSEKLRCDFGHCIRNVDILECVFSQSSSLDKYQIPKKKKSGFFLRDVEFWCSFQAVVVSVGCRGCQSCHSHSPAVGFGCPADQINKCIYPPSSADRCGSGTVLQSKSTQALS